MWALKLGFAVGAYNDENDRSVTIATFDNGSYRDWEMKWDTLVLYQYKLTHFKESTDEEYTQETSTKFE